MLGVRGGGIHILALPHTISGRPAHWPLKLVGAGVLLGFKFVHAHPWVMVSQKHCSGVLMSVWYPDVGHHHMPAGFFGFPLILAVISVPLGS